MLDQLVSESSQVFLVVDVICSEDFDVLRSPVRAVATDQIIGQECCDQSVECIVGHQEILVIVSPFIQKLHFIRAELSCNAEKYRVREDLIKIQLEFEVDFSLHALNSFRVLLEKIPDLFLILSGLQVLHFLSMKNV